MGRLKRGSEKTLTAASRSPSSVAPWTPFPAQIIGEKITWNP
jgi:hypothetical protein